MLALRTFETPLCPMTVGVSDRGLCLLGFGGPEDSARAVAELERTFGEPFRTGDHPLLDRAEAEVLAYLGGVRTGFTVPLDLPGTAWQRRVWDALLEIPFGETVSYGRLAERLGNPGGSRAVGLANGRNRVAIIVPCHRVIAADGSAHGYAGGLDRKRALLELEARRVGLFALA